MVGAKHARSGKDKSLEAGKMKEPLFMKAKKGFLLTMLALLLAAFFALVFSEETNQVENYKLELVENRVSMLTFYVDNFFHYTEAVGSISGYMALQSELDDMNITKSYRPAFELEFVNCTLYGQINSTKNCSNMENKTLIYYLDRMNQMAQSEFKIKSTYKINSLAVTQQRDAFSLDVMMNITLNVSDPFANISTTKAFISTINLNGVQDPLYLVNGTYFQVINKTNISKRESNLDANDLQSFYLGRNYWQYKGGISFLNRMEGNFTNGTFGIQSFVNHTLVYLTNPYNYSTIDYLFWNKVELKCDQGQVEYINFSLIPAIPYPPYFQIDSQNRLVFNITNQDAFRTC
jgi:hypothetical protein